jgi:hypothetical protein
MWCMYSWTAHAVGMHAMCVCVGAGGGVWGTPAKYGWTAHYSRPVHSHRQVDSTNVCAGRRGEGVPVGHQQKKGVMPRNVLLPWVQYAQRTVASQVGRCEHLRPNRRRQAWRRGVKMPACSCSSVCGPAHSRRALMGHLADSLTRRQFTSTASSSIPHPQSCRPLRVCQTKAPKVP